MNSHDFSLNYVIRKMQAHKLKARKSVNTIMGKTFPITCQELPIPTASKKFNTADNIWPLVLIQTKTRGESFATTKRKPSIVPMIAQYSTVDNVQGIVH